MSANLIELISANHKNLPLKFYGKGNVLIKDYPINGIHTQIKPSSTGIFIFGFHDFKLLNLEYMVFEKHIEKKLKNSKYEMVNFWLSGNCIYIYIKDRAYKNNEFYLEIFNFIINEFKISVDKMEKELMSFLNE